MEETRRTNAGQDETAEDGAGQVEYAGETTAAATPVGTDDHAKPVGADTRVKVAGDDHADTRADADEESGR